MAMRTPTKRRRSQLPKKPGAASLRYAIVDTQAASLDRFIKKERKGKRKITFLLFTVVFADS